MRPDGRAPDQLRPITIKLSPLAYPEGSALIQAGQTWVLCTATIQESQPRWRQEGQKGWITAEYAMLPRATQTRIPRNHTEGGRAQEIRRLIGRSLRQAVDLDSLGPRTLTIDCDVLQADGGTRTAAITGGYVALALALRKLIAAGTLPPETLRPPLAAVSVGLIEGEPRLDLNYAEDSTAEVDLNIVMNAAGDFIEIQGTAESRPLSRPLLADMLDLAAIGVTQLIAAQREALS